MDKSQELGLLLASVLYHRKMSVQQFAHKMNKDLEWIKSLIVGEVNSDFKFWSKAYVVLDYDFITVIDPNEEKQEKDMITYEPGKRIA